VLTTVIAAFGNSKIESAFGLQPTPYRQGISESLGANN
jgi:hypothetical protein